MDATTHHVRQCPAPFNDLVRLCAKLLAEMATICALPTWALTRTARLPHMDNVDPCFAARARRIIQDGQIALTQRRLLDAYDDLLAATRTLPAHTFMAWLRAFAHLAPLGFLVASWARYVLSKRRHTAKAVSGLLAHAVPVLAHNYYLATQIRLARPVLCDFIRAVSTLHPVLQVTIRAFLAEIKRNGSAPSNALQKLLAKGPGFVPTPERHEFLFEVAAHSIAIANNTDWTLPTHARTQFHNRLMDLACKVSFPSNISSDERCALGKARKDRQHFFVPTDKTGRIVAIKKDLLLFSIECTIRSRQGRGGFDILDDAVTLASQMQELKERLRAAIPRFRAQGEAWRREHAQSHHPPLATRIAETLADTANYLPTFGAVKPLLKDHKLPCSLETALARAPPCEPLPLRLTHDATVGPTNAIAGLVNPVLEMLAKRCALALAQAGHEVVQFAARTRFAARPSVGVADVSDAFWTMLDHVVYERVTYVAAQNPDVLVLFNTHIDTIIDVLRLVFCDNFFIALGYSAAIIVGRFVGCTMGNQISKASCEIYYFEAIRQGLQVAPAGQIIFVRAGGDDSIIIAWSDHAIRSLLDAMRNLHDGWSYTLKLMDSDNELAFFDVRVRRRQLPESHFWVLDTEVFFKEADTLMRTWASSFWSDTHAEALLRAHLLRVCRYCSTVEGAVVSAQALGVVLARRQHPLENMLQSFARLRPHFLVDTVKHTDHVGPQNTPAIHPWSHRQCADKARPPKIVLSFPFCGATQPHVRRIIVDTWRTAFPTHHLTATDICTPSTPFRSLTRLLPCGKPSPPLLLSSCVVYCIPAIPRRRTHGGALAPFLMHHPDAPLRESANIGDEVHLSPNSTPSAQIQSSPITRDSQNSSTQESVPLDRAGQHICYGIGEVGVRPLIHRMIEHALAAHRNLGPYRAHLIAPLATVRILKSATDHSLRRAYESLFISSTPNCLTTPTISAGPWVSLFADGNKCGNRWAIGQDKPSLIPQALQLLFDTWDSNREWIHRPMSWPRHWTLGGGGSQHGAQLPHTGPKMFSQIVRTALEIDSDDTFVNFTAPPEMPRSDLCLSPPQHAWRPEFWALVPSKSMAHAAARSWKNPNAAFTVFLLKLTCQVCDEPCAWSEPYVADDCVVCFMCRRPFHRRCCANNRFAGAPRMARAVHHVGCPWACQACHTQINGLLQRNHANSGISKETLTCFEFKHESLRNVDAQHEQQTDFTWVDPNSRAIFVPLAGAEHCPLVPLATGPKSIDLADLIPASLSTACMQDSARRAQVQNKIPQHCGNARYAQTVFGNPVQTFLDVFDGACEDCFIEQHAGLCLDLLNAAIKPAKPFWCVHMTSSYIPACPFHFFCRGQWNTQYFINEAMLQDKWSAAAKHDPVIITDLQLLPCPSNEERCFFSALSIALFGSPAFALLLKMRALLWLATATSEGRFDEWLSPAACTSQQTTQKAADIIFSIAAGAVSDEAFPFMLAWSLLDLQINIIVTYATALTAIPKRGILSGSMLARAHTATFTGASAAICDICLYNADGHFTAYTWVSLVATRIAHVCATPHNSGIIKRDIAYNFFAILNILANVEEVCGNLVPNEVRGPPQMCPVESPMYGGGSTCPIRIMQECNARLRAQRTRAADPPTSVLSPRVPPAHSVSERHAIRPQCDGEQNALSASPTHIQPAHESDQDAEIQDIIQASATADLPDVPNLPDSERNNARSMLPTSDTEPGACECDDRITNGRPIPRQQASAALRMCEGFFSAGTLSGPCDSSDYSGQPGFGKQDTTAGWYDAQRAIPNSQPFCEWESSWHPGLSTFHADDVEPHSELDITQHLSKPSSFNHSQTPAEHTQIPRPTYADVVRQANTSIRSPWSTPTPYTPALSAVFDEQQDSLWHMSNNDFGIGARTATRAHTSSCDARHSEQHQAPACLPEHPFDAPSVLYHLAPDEKPDVTASSNDDSNVCPPLSMLDISLPTPRQDVPHISCHHVGVTTAHDGNVEAMLPPYPPENTVKYNTYVFTPIPCAHKRRAVIKAAQRLFNNIISIFFGTAPLWPCECCVIYTKTRLTKGISRQMHAILRWGATPSDSSSQEESAGEPGIYHDSETWYPLDARDDDSHEPMSHSEQDILRWEYVHRRRRVQWADTLVRVHTDMQQPLCPPALFSTPSDSRSYGSQSVSPVVPRSDRQYAPPNFNEMIDEGLLKRRADTDTLPHTTGDATDQMRSGQIHNAHDRKRHQRRRQRRYRAHRSSRQPTLPHLLHQQQDPSASSSSGRTVRTACRSDNTVSFSRGLREKPGVSHCDTITQKSDSADRGHRQHTRRVSPLQHRHFLCFGMQCDLNRCKELRLDDARPHTRKQCVFTVEQQDEPLTIMNPCDEHELSVWAEAHTTTEGAGLIHAIIQATRQHGRGPTCQFSDEHGSQSRGAVTCYNSNPDATVSHDSLSHTVPLCGGSSARDILCYVPHAAHISQRSCPSSRQLKAQIHKQILTTIQNLTLMCLHWHTRFLPSFLHQTHTPHTHSLCSTDTTCGITYSQSVRPTSSFLSSHKQGRTSRHTKLSTTCATPDRGAPDAPGPEHDRIQWHGHVVPGAHAHYGVDDTGFEDLLQVLISPACDDSWLPRASHAVDRDNAMRCWHANQYPLEAHEAPRRSQALQTPHGLAPPDCSTLVCDAHDAPVWCDACSDVQSGTQLVLAPRLSAHTDCTTSALFAFLLTHSGKKPWHSAQRHDALRHRPCPALLHVPYPQRARDAGYQHARLRGRPMYVSTYPYRLHEPHVPHNAISGAVWFQMEYNDMYNAQPTSPCMTSSRPCTTQCTTRGPNADTEISPLLVNSEAFHAAVHEACVRHDALLRGNDAAPSHDARDNAYTEQDLWKKFVDTFRPHSAAHRDVLMHVPPQSSNAAALLSFDANANFTHPHTHANALGSEKCHNASVVMLLCASTTPHVMHPAHRL